MTPSRPGSARRALAALGAWVLLAVPLAGCGGDDDPYATYCAEVKSQQKPLSEALAVGGPLALIQALPSFEQLAAVSPDDLADEWRTLVDSISTLVGALEDAGVDPADYDRDDPPEDLTDADQDRIDAAARRLTRPGTVAALDGVQQQARDVCKTPLSF